MEERLCFAPSAVPHLRLCWQSLIGFTHKAHREMGTFQPSLFPGRLTAGWLQLDYWEAWVQGVQRVSVTPGEKHYSLVPCCARGSDLETSDSNLVRQRKGLAGPQTSLWPHTDSLALPQTLLRRCPCLHCSSCECKTRPSF